MDVLAKFIKAWGHPDHPPTPVAHSEIEALEAEIAVRFPEDYRSQILSHGLPRPTVDLWEWMFDQENEAKEAPLEMLADFFQPSEIRTGLVWIDAGMPEHLVPFASDSMGNQIAFSRDEMSAGEASRSAVYFWDHEFGTVDKIGASFSDWLRSYLP